jgi:hypothetical protein
MDLGLLFLISVVSIGIIILFLIRKPKAGGWKNKVRQKLSSINSSDPKSALIELDKLLEFALQNKFNLKDSIGNILKSKANQFNKPDLNDIWTAHKIRNNLAHNIDYQASSGELNLAIKILTRFCRSLSE